MKTFINKTKGIFMYFINCNEAFFKGIKSIKGDKNCFWTINETFFVGENAKSKRDTFEIEFNNLLAKYKTTHRN